MKNHNVIIFILITSFVLISCKDTLEEKQRKYVKMNNLNDVMTNLKPLRSHHEFSNSEETVIECEQGTILYIPANSFVFENGASPKESVKITIKESYDIASMVGQGLHTESQGSILESGGMVYMKAEADGKKLIIKEGSAIQLGFPKKNSEKEMDLFYSVKQKDGKSTWVPDYKMFELDRVPLSENSNSEAAPPVEYPIEITEDMFDYFISCSGGNGASLDGIISGTDKKMFYYLMDQKNTKVDFAKEFYKHNYDFFVDFNIDENGKMNNFRLASEDDGYYYQDTPRYSEEAFKQYVNYLKEMPPFETSSFPEGIKPGWDYSVGVSAYRGIDWQKFKDRFRAQFKETRNDASKKISRLDLECYVFSVTELGWINCDKFIDFPEDQKTDFVVKTSGNEDQKIRLIFENKGVEKTIMNGEIKDGFTLFKGVPIGQVVTVIGIGLNDRGPTFAKANTTISKDDFNLTSFKNVEIEELERELNLIN